RLELAAADDQEAGVRTVAETARKGPDAHVEALLLYEAPGEAAEEAFGLRALAVVQGGGIGRHPDHVQLLGGTTEVLHPLRHARPLRHHRAHALEQAAVAASPARALHEAALGGVVAVEARHEPGPESLGETGLNRGERAVVHVDHCGRRRAKRARQQPAARAARLEERTVRQSQIAP